MHSPDPDCFPSPTHELLLRAALHEGDRAREAFRAWRAQVDPEVLDNGTYRTLPLLARNLLRLGITDPYLGRWKGTYRRTFFMNETLFRELAPLLAALEREGIPALLLKGAALVAGVYRESALRPMLDLDILVPRERALRAFAVLRERGWRSRARSPERVLGVRHGTPFVGPNGREIDLHWHLLWENCAAGADDAVWAAAAEGRLGAQAVRVPCAADQLLHVCVHGLQWSGEPQLRWACDAFLLAASGAVDWERLASETARRGLALPVRTALRWVKEHLDAPVPAPLLARLDALPTSERDRRELAAKLLPMRGLTSVRVYWSHHARASAALGRGRLATLLHFLPYLQHSWEVEHLIQLPYFMIYRGLRRLWIDARPPRPEAGDLAAGAPAQRRPAPAAGVLTTRSI